MFDELISSKEYFILLRISVHHYSHHIIKLPSAIDLALNETDGNIRTDGDGILKKYFTIIVFEG